MLSEDDKKALQKVSESTDHCMEIHQTPRKGAELERYLAETKRREMTKKDGEKQTGLEEF